MTESYHCSRGWQIRPACLPTSPSQCARNRKLQPCCGHMSASKRAPSIAVCFNHSCTTIVPSPKARPFIVLPIPPLPQLRAITCLSSYSTRSRVGTQDWPQTWPAHFRHRSPERVQAMHLTHRRSLRLPKENSSVAICWSAWHYELSRAIRPKPCPH